MLGLVNSRLDRNGMGLGVVALGFSLIPVVLGSNIIVMDVGILLFVYATVAYAWNLIGGYVGQFALSTAVFYGIGAYTSTMLFSAYAISPWVGMLIGGIIAVIVAVIIGYPCLRLGFHYFALGTFVIGESVRLLFLNWNFVGGALGLYVPIRPPGLAAFQFRERWPYYYISLGLMLVALGTTYVITRTRLVFYMRATKDDPGAAQSLGINVPFIRLTVFCLTAFLTALPGTFMAQFVLFIDPISVLDVQISVLATLIPILGGVGTVWGPLLGALVLIPLGEATREAFGGTGSAVDLVIFGALIMTLAVFRPKGLIGIFQDLLAVRRARGRRIKVSRPESGSD